MFLPRPVILFLAVMLFVCIYNITIYIQPSIMFYEDGTIRDFGIGYRNKTICPVWLFAILLGTLCYLFVLYILYTV